jgi:hypothetical protein
VVRIRRRLTIIGVALAAAAMMATGAWSQAASASTTPGTKPATTAAATGITITVATERQMLKLYAAYRHLPVADIAPVRSGEAKGARVRATGKEWAELIFAPAARARISVTTEFQDGAEAGVFARATSKAAWKLAGLAGEPFACAEHLPTAVRQLWQLTACATAANLSPPRGITPDSQTQQAADIALAQNGVSDNPASVDQTDSTDCNPFTDLVDDTSGTPCGTTDSKFGVEDWSLLWCADFAKWVWEQAGVTSDLTTLGEYGASGNFVTWGQDEGESLSFTQSTSGAAVGDAVVFYTPGGSLSDPTNGDDVHVGIVYSINPDGSLSLVDGDFAGSTNTSVQFNNTGTDMESWADGIWGYSGMKWVFVSPELSTLNRSPAAAVDPNGNRYVFWKNTGGGLEETWYNASSASWSSAATVDNSDGGGLGPLGSAPSVAISPTEHDGTNYYQYVFWEGTDQNLWEAYWNGSWNGPVDLGDGPLGSQPTAGIDANGHLYVFWENTNPNRGLEETDYNGSSWSGAFQVTNSSGDSLGPLGSAPTVAVSETQDSGGDGYQYVFWEGTGGADLWEAYWNGSWNGPIDLGDGALGSPPSAATDYEGDLYVFWSSADGNLWEADYDAADSTWSHPELGYPTLGSAPAVAVDPAGDQYVFWHGPGSGADLYEVTDDDGTWSSAATNLGDGPLTD